MFLYSMLVIHSGYLVQKTYRLDNFLGTGNNNFQTAQLKQLKSKYEYSNIIIYYNIVLFMIYPNKFVIL